MLIPQTQLLSLIVAILTSSFAFAQYPDYYGLSRTSYVYSLADYNRSLAESYFIFQQSEKQRIRNAEDLIELKKKYLDFKKYEYAETVNFENFKRDTQRATNEDRFTHPDASDEDIRSGRALNIQLNFFKERKALLDVSNSEAIPALCLQPGKINFVSSEKTGGSLSLLMHKEIPWTMIFQDAIFQKQRAIVDEQIKLLKQQAISTGAKWSTFDVVREAIRQLEETKRNHAGRWLNGHACSEANLLLRQLRQALNDLQEHPNELAIYLRPLEGKTVAEVVKYMTESGIEFGPATPHQKLEYKCLYDAFAAEMRRIKSDSKP